MNHLLLVLCLFLFTTTVSAQDAESIQIGKKENFFSKVLNENRKLWIYTPNFSSLQNDSNKKYPVVYLLDGDAHFYSTVGIIQQLSQANGNGVLPEMIVVGIENTNRLRDLTPAAPASGKTNSFVSFLTSELIPYIDQKYNSSPYKILVGHSLGGLLAINILSNSPQFFNAYIAIDPSMWYNNEKYLNHSMTTLPKSDLSRTRLFIGTANTMTKGMTLSKLKNDRSPETQHIRSIFKLDSFLQKNTTGLRYAQKYYEQERHNTVPLLSEYDGLRFIFNYFYLDLTEKDFIDSTALIASTLKTHYTKVSKEMGYKVAAPEGLINYLGYDAMNKKQYRKAEALFKLNIEDYPNSNNVYDSYADYHRAKKDTLNAIAYYKKALEIKNEPTTIVKLNALTKAEPYSISVKDLEKYIGEYVLEAYKVSVILEIREGKLWSKVPGQTDSELLPVAKHIFTVKGKQGYTISFEMNGDKPISFTSVQPNGTFHAVYKK